jgi:hypothetical protein
MKISISITLLIFICCASPLLAETVSFSFGINAGVMSSMGGDLDSDSQDTYYGSASGIDGINRKMDGYSTSNIDRLKGFLCGIETKLIFYDYYLLRAGANYGMSLTGGRGKTVFYSSADADYFLLECEYTYKVYDFPLTIGLSVPFWKDARVSVSCGAAYAGAVYKNKFTSEDTTTPFEREGHFSGWGIPLVVVFESDYLINNFTALTGEISYYNGSSKVIKDSDDTDGDVDLASIDFTGYRFNLGISFYFNN